MRNPIRVTLCETESFFRHAVMLWSESELESLKDYLAEHPLAGDEIPATGGVRKLRWSRHGMGKRGGARVIYYFYDASAPLYLLYAYAKGKQEDLSSLEKRAVSQVSETLKAEIKAGRRRRG